MFALGTYIKNTPDDGHNDHATSIELKVVMTLLPLVNDGSPIVRQVSQRNPHLATVPGQGFI